MLEALVSFFIELDEDKVVITIQRLIKAGIEKKKVVEALNKALDIIGKKYETGEYTLSDLMMAGILYEQVMEMDCIDISKSIEKSALKNGMIDRLCFQYWFILKGRDEMDYKSTVTTIGPLVEEMAEEGNFIIVFNENAPESLAEMSVLHTICDMDRS